MQMRPEFHLLDPRASLLLIRVPLKRNLQALLETPSDSPSTTGGTDSEAGSATESEDSLLEQVLGPHQRAAAAFLSADGLEIREQTASETLGRSESSGSVSDTEEEVSERSDLTPIISKNIKEVS